MTEEQSTLIGRDGRRIVYHRWLPDQATPRAVMHIIHGMTEHSLRYRWFAAQLCARGFAVYADDHRGHGFTAASPDDLSHLDRGDAVRMVDDEELMHKRIESDFPGLPRYLFAHSMGSFIGRCLLARPCSYQGAVICGSGYKSAVVPAFARMFAAAAAMLQGIRHRSRLIDHLTFGSFNRLCEKRTPFDWLTREQYCVDSFIADPRCGVLCTTGFFLTLFTLVQTACASRTIRAVPATLPILLIAGDRDPVGSYGVAVEHLLCAMQKSGLAACRLKLYPQARHELVNEINREEVVRDILDWIESPGRGALNRNARR